MTDRVERTAGASGIQPAEPGDRRVVGPVGRIGRRGGAAGHDHRVRVGSLDRGVRGLHHGRVLVRVGVGHRELLMIRLVPQRPHLDRAAQSGDRTGRPVARRRLTHEASVVGRVLREAVELARRTVAAPRPRRAVRGDTDDVEPARSRCEHGPIGRCVPPPRCGTVVLDVVPVDVEGHPGRARVADGVEVRGLVRVGLPEDLGPGRHSRASRDVGGRRLDGARRGKLTAGHGRHPHRHEHHDGHRARDAATKDPAHADDPFFARRFPVGVDHPAWELEPKDPRNVRTDRAFGAGTAPAAPLGNTVESDVPQEGAGRTSRSQLPCRWLSIRRPEPRRDLAAPMRRRPPGR